VPGASRLRSPKVDERTHVNEHLEELRWRLVVVGSTLIVLFGVAYWFRDLLFGVLNRPLGDDYPIQTLAVTEPLFASITVAAHTALAVSVPLLVYHVYRFVAPALEPPQRRGIRLLLLLTPGLFYAGVAFCYWFVLGPAVRFLLGLGEGSFEVTVRAREYYGFVSTTLLAMGLVFLFPLVLLGLARLGIISSDLLRSNRKVAFVLVAITAALLPTADPVSLVVEMVPLIALFELSIVLVRLQERSVRKRQARDGA
jgi:sec-independent protein translocase protein TatC